MFSRQMFTHIALVAAMLCLSTRVRAQSPPDYMRVNAGGWTFAPAISQGNLIRLLAWPEEVETIGDNIKVLWFQKVSGEWQSWGWEGNSLGKAVVYLRSQLEDETIFSKDTTVISMGCPAEVEAISPRQVSKGLFVDDPFQPILDVIEYRATLLNTLGEAGWPTVRSLSSYAVDGVLCNEVFISQQKILLDDIAQKVNVGLLGQQSVEENCAISWPCSCTINYGAPTCGAWTPDPIFPTTPLQGGGTNCHYVRTCTRTYTATGRHWTCWSCAGTGTDSYEESGRTTALPGDPCVPPPP